MKDVVIGAGITGLIYAFYSKQVILVGEYKEFKNPFVFIQKNKYTEELLSDLGLTCTSSYVNVKADIDLKQIINSKVKQRDFFYSGTDKIANIGENLSLEVFDITEVEICKMIEDRIRDRRIYENVKRITNNTVITNADTIIYYDKLFSTVNFNVFEKLFSSWEHGENIFYSDLYFKVEKSKVQDKFNYIRYPDDNHISKIVVNKFYGLKGTEYKEKEICDMTKGCIVFKNSRFSGKINPSPKNIFFVGRFATANNHWRIEDSIFCSKYGNIFLEMFSEQERFDSAIRTSTGVVGEERINKLVLHAYSELSELMREINWKMNEKKTKKVNSSSIIEECIDVIKLVFAILLEFSYTPREIYEMFFEKSKKNWDVFLKNFFGGV